MKSRIVTTSLLRDPAGKHTARRKWLLLTFVALVAIGFHILSAKAPAAPQASLLYSINSTGDGDLVGSSNICDDGTGHCTLRAAIEAANIHPGVDGIRFNLPAGSVINLPRVLPDITEGVSITSPLANPVTVRRNSGSGFRIFNVTTTALVTFSGLTISNGRVLSSDGGGGGIADVTNGRVNITNCTISFNSTNDVVHGFGGALQNQGVMNVTNCTLKGNSAGTGGAVDNKGIINVTNCTLTGNSSASGSSGGILNEYVGTANVTNCTISGNDGGLFTGNGAGAGITSVRSSIIALNTSFDVIGTFTSGGFNLIGKNNGATASFPVGNPNSNNDIVGSSELPVDPMLDPNGLQNNGGPTQTIALLPDSQAIDKGTSNGLTGHLTTDQRGAGFARTFDYPSIMNAAGEDGTDIGAFELLVPFAVSRKMHGATAFDVNLPITGAPGIECRMGGANSNHQVIVTFSFAIASIGSASVTSGSGSVSNFTASGSQVIVNLTGVANAQTIVVTLLEVSDGTNSYNLSVPMGVLLGDANGNGSVNATDISLTKLKSGQPVDTTNFRTDVTVSGTINASDVSLVKLKSGTGLP